MRNKYIGLSWIEDFKSKQDCYNTVADLLGLYTDVTKCVHGKDLATITTLLKTVDVKVATPLVMIGLLRLTFQIRDNLSYWYHLRGEVYWECHNRGLDVDSIMEGLL